VEQFCNALRVPIEVEAGYPVSLAGKNANDTRGYADLRRKSRVSEGWTRIFSTGMALLGR
jgi:hypothetical protein